MSADSKTSAADLVEQAIATLRLTRLVREDTITEPLRRAFFTRFSPAMQTTPDVERPKGPGWLPVTTGGSDEVLGWYRQGSKLGQFVRDLMGCPYWCLPVWTGAAIAITARCGPVGRFLVRTLASSQAVAVLYDVAVSLRAMKERIEEKPKAKADWST